MSTPNTDTPPTEEKVDPPVVEDEGQVPPADEQGNEPDDQADTTTGIKTLEDALAEVTTTRREAANYRTRLRALEAELEKVTTPEQVAELVANAKAEAEAEARTLLVENVALKHGLPDDLAALLKGDTAEELAAHAETLKKYVPADPAPEEENDPDVQGGLGGTSAGSAFDAKALVAKARKRRY
jgi:hypothetical protein